MFFEQDSVAQQLRHCNCAFLAAQREHAIPYGAKCYHIKFSKGRRETQSLSCVGISLDFKAHLSKQPIPDSNQENRRVHLPMVGIPCEVQIDSLHMLGIRKCVKYSAIEKGLKS
jgi:hypothetical protein